MHPHRRPNIASVAACAAMVAGFVLTSCSGEETRPAPRNESGTPVDRGPPVDVPVDHPEMDQLDVSSRAPRRMSVEQLERSLEVIGRFPEGDIVIPADLAFTLGRPDYLRVTDESVEPSPLFMKFMVDLGGFFCGAIAQVEEVRPVDDRVFTRFASLDENLASMLVTFTGIDGSDAEPYVTRLRRVFEAGRAGPRGDLSGYEAACLALFTSPEFLLY